MDHRPGVVAPRVRRGDLSSRDRRTAPRRCRRRRSHPQSRRNVGRVEREARPRSRPTTSSWPTPASSPASSRSARTTAPKIVVRFGPMELDLATFVSMRLSEHTLHTWDVEVALDPTATLHPTQVDLVIDSLEQASAASRGGPTAPAERCTCVRPDPVRDFVVATTTESVTVERGDASTPHRPRPAGRELHPLDLRTPRCRSTPRLASRHHCSPSCGECSRVSEKRACTLCRVRCRPRPIRAQPHF